MSRTTVWLTHNRARLAMHCLRGGEGRPLLLLHGLGEQSPHVVPPWAEPWRGPVWALDFTGHGESEIPLGGGYSAEILLADADHALAHLGTATVVGRGLGALGFRWLEEPMPQRGGYASYETVAAALDISLAGGVYPNPANQCWPEPGPFIYKNFGLQILRNKPDELTLIYDQDHEVRRVRMNSAHPANVKPSFYGDAIGRYEGDSLVIDTIGQNTKLPVDAYRTPHTEKLHVVERYRVYATPFGKRLELVIRVEDAGTFTMPWKGLITYRRAARKEWEERICAENIEHYYGATQYYSDKNAHVPMADRPDF